jgi:hypothetical protein
MEDQAQALGAARLDNWFVRYNPIAGSVHLAGEVSGHARLADGSEIVTSEVAELSVAERKAVTRNTRYSLGEPFKIDPKEVIREIIGEAVAKRDAERGPLN